MNDANLDLTSGHLNELFGILVIAARNDEWILKEIRKGDPLLSNPGIVKKSKLIGDLRKRELIDLSNRADSWNEELIVDLWNEKLIVLWNKMLIVDFRKKGLTVDLSKEEWIVKLWNEELIVVLWTKELIDL